MVKNWWRVLAGLMILIGGVVLLVEQLGLVAFTGSVWGGLGLLGGGVAFLAAWLGDRSEWWPLIPAGVMLGGGLGTLAGSVGLPGWLSVLLTFSGCSLPFLYIFLRLGAKEGWWALIPGGILAAWGVGSFLGELGLPGAIVSLVGFLGSAAPFLFIFMLNRKNNWWALIPGGIMAFMSLVTVLESALGEQWIAPLILLGIALVFLGVFVVNRTNWWALIPAGVLALVGVGVSPIAGSLWMFGSLALILLGVLLILRTVLRRG